MRSPSLAASSMSWVTKTIVFLSVALEIEELLLEPLTGHRVDGAERLVHEEHRWITTEGPGHAHPLALAPGKLVRKAPGVLLRVETDQLEQLLHPRVDPLLLPAEEAGHGGDVVGHPAVRKQSTLLDHVADTPAQLDRVHLQDVDPVDQDAAARGLDQTIDHPQRGRLPAPRRPDEHTELAVGHGEAQRSHGDGVCAIALRHPVERDHGRRHYPPLQ